MTAEGNKMPWPALVALVLAVPLAILMAVTALRPEEGDPLREIHLATGEWAPFSGEALPEFGRASALVSLVFREMGYKASYHFLPWQRAYDTAAANEHNGGIRGCFPYFRNEERERDFYFSDPILSARTALFYDHEKHPEIGECTSLEQLAGRRFLFIDGYRYPPRIEAMTNIAPTNASRTLEAFRRLIEEPGIELVPESEEVGLQTLRRELPKFRSRIRKAPIEADSLQLNLYVMFSKNNPHNARLRERFNRALAAVKADGRHERAHQRAVEALNRAEMVILQPFEQGRIVAYLDAGRSRSVLLPTGSEAVVDEWDEAFLRPSEAAPEAGGTLVRVRLLNGPLAGELVLVDGRSIRLR